MSALRAGDARVDVGVDGGVDAAVGVDVDAALARLRDVCPQVRAAAAGDAVDGVPAALVARPGSTAQTADVLRAAAASGLAVVARGRGTKLGWGAPPRRLDLILDTSAMEAVVDHAAGDLIVETQAGARLADVQAVVASAGQRLAVDESAPGASIGGTLATGASGPLRLAAGTVRDLLIGVTFVRADGVVAHAGGRVVKNVAGYDLGKLLVASFGTLGIITQAVFRLHPLPQARAVVTAAATDAAHAARLTRAVLGSQVVPAALEVEWAPAAGTPGGPDGPGGAAAPGTVSVLLEGTAAGVTARAHRLAALLGPAAVIGDELPAGWGRYPWQVEGGTGLKLTFATSALAQVLAAAHPAAVRGSAGAGVLYAALAPTAPVADVAALLRRLRAVCAAAGGAVTVVQAPAHVRAGLAEHGLDVWGPVGALDLMRAVKDRFDPDHRLAPGRFVGGI